MSRQTSMNISLPDTLRQWVEERVTTEGYGTASEHFRALLRDEQKRKPREDLDRKPLEAVERGPSVEMTSADWRKIRSTVRRRLAKKGKAGA